MAKPWGFLQLPTKHVIMFHIYRELLLFTLNFISLMTNFIWFLHQTMEIFTVQVKILNSFQYFFHFLVDTLLHSTYLQSYIECAITVWYILYHRLEQCSEFKVMYMCAELLSHAWLFETPWTVAHHLLCPWDSPGKNTGVGCHALQQEISPTWGLHPRLLCLLH